MIVLTVLSLALVHSAPDKRRRRYEGTMTGHIHCRSNCSWGGARLVPLGWGYDRTYRPLPRSGTFCSARAPTEIWEKWTMKGHIHCRSHCPWGGVRLVPLGWWYDRTYRPLPRSGTFCSARAQTEIWGNWTRTGHSHCRSHCPLK